MNAELKNWMVQYLRFSRKDRNSILLLAVLVIIAFAARYALSRVDLRGGNVSDSSRRAMEIWFASDTLPEQKTLFAFDPNTISQESLDTLKLPDNVKRNLVKYRQAGGNFKNREDMRRLYGMNDSLFLLISDFIRIEDKRSVPDETAEPVLSDTGYFDPNTAGYQLLKSYGFTSFQANNLIKFREKNGFIYQPSDLMGIYGMDSAAFGRIKNHVRIAGWQGKNVMPDGGGKEALVDINRADSLELVKLPGIGPVFASRIIRYRNLLGGYYSVSQLREIYNFPEQTYNRLHGYFTADTLLVDKLRINFAEFGEMLRHPYLELEDVKAITDYRDRHGPFRSAVQIKEAGLVSDSTYLKLRPYISCR